MREVVGGGSVVGKLMVVIGVLVIFPTIVLFWYPSDIKYLISFLIPGLISICLGIALILILKEKERENWRDRLKMGCDIVLFTWTWGAIIGALPFILSKQLKTVPALFEAVSGWTTTGLSTMDVTATPKIFLFHRSFMQYCGGLGFIMMAIVFMNTKYSMNLYNAEGHSDKIKPNLKNTSKVIFLMYFGYLIVGTILYIFSGVNFFESVTNAMCALSTGGFSIRADSFASYRNNWVFIITIILMIIGTTNFAVLSMISKGKIKKAIKVSETKLLIFIIAVILPIISIILYIKTNLSFSKIIKIGFFDGISAISTTGFSTVDYNTLPAATIFILTLLMFIGGGMGSTAGGLKLARLVIILKIIVINIDKKINPINRIKKYKYVRADGEKEINSDLILDIVGFFITYLLIFLAGSTLIMYFENVDITKSMFEFASSLATVGLSIGVTSPTTSNPTLIVEIIGMILGRLEIFVVFIGITLGYRNLKVIFSKR